MKLTTSIIARADGTVTAAIPGVKKPYTFRQEDEVDDTLVCEVTTEADIVWLLRTKQFFPASDEDYEAAAKLTKKPEPVAKAPEQIPVADAVKQQAEGYQVEEVDLDDAADDETAADSDAGTVKPDEGQGDVFDSMEDTELREYIEKKNGKAPPKFVTHIALVKKARKASLVV